MPDKNKLERGNASNSTDLLAEFYEQTPEKKGNKILLKWIPVQSEFHKHDEVASAYIVVELPDNRGHGLMIYARWDRTKYGQGVEWVANPWTARPVIKKLMNLCS